MTVFINVLGKARITAIVLKRVEMFFKHTESSVNYKILRL